MNRDYRWVLVGGGLLLALFCLLLPKFLILIIPERYKQTVILQAFHLWVGVVAVYIMFWLVYGVAVFFVGNALLPTFSSSGSLMGTVSAASLSWVLGFIVIFVPAGLGVRDWSLERLLILSAGLDPWLSKLIAILCRFNILIAETSWLIIAGSLYLNEKGKQGRKKPSVLL